MDHQLHEHCRSQIYLRQSFAHYIVYCIIICYWYSETIYSIIEVDDDKIIEYDIQPIHLSQPANIKNGDQVYVIQHPRGGSLAFSSSESTVNSESVHVYTVCVRVCGVFVYI